LAVGKGKPPFAGTPTSLIDQIREFSRPVSTQQLQDHKNVNRQSMRLSGRQLHLKPQMQMNLLGIGQ